MTEIKFDDDVPQEIQDAALPIVERWAWLIPQWCLWLSVGNTTRASEDGGCATNTTREEYRFARIMLTPVWLEENDRDREFEIVHEILHIPIAPMHELMGAAMEKSDNEPYKALVEEQWRKAMEGAVQDLAYALMNRASDH